MNRLRLRATVLGGAAIGLVAGAAAFGAVSSSSAPAPFKPALVSADVSADTQPALPAASCAAGQELEHGVCIVHVEKVVVIPAPAVVQADDSASAAVPGATSDTGELSGSSESSEHATEVGGDDAEEAAHDAEEAAHDAEEAAHDAEDAAHDAAEHATEAVEHSTQDDS